ncbi:MAG: hypothetical protein Q8N18_00460 [Opitutaceae bacterium]|nr:hypothetical protein [Opitutaceae bacterium]
MKPDTREPEDMTHIPSWVVGLCGVAAVASVLFSILLLLNH